MSGSVPLADLQAMRRSYLFSGLDDDQYSAIAGHAELLELAPGQLLFSTGDAVTAFYWVAEGVVRLYRSSPQGDEKVIELIGPGRFFAEAALFMGWRFPVNATTQTAARLIAVDGPGFMAWLRQDVGRCFKLLAGLSARLHKMINEIDSLALMKGTDRLLQYLLDHSDPADDGRLVVELEAPKQVIASRIGVKPETLSRLLHKLADRGYIETRGNQVYIRDADQLSQAQLD